MCDSNKIFKTVMYILPQLKNYNSWLSYMFAQRLPCRSWLCVHCKENKYRQTAIMSMSLSFQRRKNICLRSVVLKRKSRLANTIAHLHKREAMLKLQWTKNTHTYICMYLYCGSWLAISLCQIWRQNKHFLFFMK